MKLLATAAVAIIALAAGPATADEEKKQSKISYSFIEGAYVHDNFNANGLQITDRDFEGDITDDNFGTLFDDAGNGFGGRISVELPFGTESLGFHAVTDYAQTDHDVGIDIVKVGGFGANGRLDTTQKEWRLALGMNGMVSESVSLFAELGFVNNKVDFTNAALVLDTGETAVGELSAASGSRTALDVKAGFRAMVTRKLELTAFARYHGNGDLDTSADGLRVDFSGKVKAGGGAFYHFSERLALGLDVEVGTPGRARLAARLSF